MKNFIFAILLSPLLTIGQITVPKDSIVPNGTLIGNQVVIPIPVALAGYALGQAIIYYPDDYFLPKNANKRYPLYVFLHGAGEGAKLNISEVTNTSLPYLIKNGLKPYGIDPVTGDTIKFIIVSPHCALCGGSYSFPQLKFTIPFLFKAYRVDTSCVWVGGLSSGGSCTWSMAMGASGNPSALDTAITKRITGIMPMANGGYDLAINNSINRGNLDTTARRGLACLYVIGDQDPGYNPLGFFAYQAEMKKYCQPGRYFDSVIKGGTHSANVWNTPFPLTARLWSKSMNSWTQMWTMRKSGSSIQLPPNPLHAKLWAETLNIAYPQTSVWFADSSTTPHTYVMWGATNYPLNWPGRWSGGCIGSRILYGNLVEGSYKVQMIIGDDLGNTDTAFANLRVYGPPVCPPLRTVTGFEYTNVNGALALKLTYSDGYTEIIQP